MYKKIEIRNLRAITKLEIDNLGQINLFVGNNNCGKTTVLEALFFLIGATNPQLPITVNTFRGLPFLSSTLWMTFFNNLQYTNPIEILGLISDSSNEQKLLIHPHYKKATVKEELEVSTVSFRGDSKPIAEIDGLELTYTETENPGREDVSRIFLKNNELVSEGVKGGPVRGIFVSPLTEFSWKDRFDSIQQRKKVSDVINAVRKIEPKISDLRLNAVGLLVGDIGLSNLIPVNLFGGGTARFLSIALAMVDTPKGIVLIDELDDGLHHSAQENVWKAIFDWAQTLDVQVFATTHSYECIKAFRACAGESLFPEKAKLFRIEREVDKFRTIEFMPDEITRFLENMWEIR